MTHYLVILALIQSLTQKVEALEAQLAQMQSQSAVVGAVATPSSTESTPVVAPVTQTTNMPEQATPTISVSFAASADSEGLVTVKNTLNVPVRIKSLDVDGTLVGFTIGTKYGDGMVYPPSFADTQGTSFDVFTCTGLGSLGQANMGASGMVDPCVRRDANLAKNELQPGETMILRYL